MFATANSCFSNQEFSKIGNKVFIPPGVKTSPREPRFVLVPRAGLGKPWSASNANKPASSWPLKQGPKKWSKHGCDKGTLTVATGLGTHKEKKV